MLKTVIFIFIFINENIQELSLCSILVQLSRVNNYRWGGLGIYWKTERRIESIKDEDKK